MGWEQGTDERRRKGSGIRVPLVELRILMKEELRSLASEQHCQRRAGDHGNTVGILGIERN